MTVPNRDAVLETLPKETHAPLDLPQIAKSMRKSRGLPNYRAQHHGDYFPGGGACSVRPGMAAGSTFSRARSAS